MVAGKPVWSTSSLLLYVGGLTVLGAAVRALEYLSSSYRDAAYAGWSALVVIVLAAIAHGFRRRDRPIAAGIFAFASVFAWAAFLSALWVWFGWLSASSSSTFGGFSFARLSLELLVLVAARGARRRFRFPLITVIVATVGWLFVTDLVSGGGSWSAVVTLLIGIVYLGLGSARGDPGAFWLHVVGGLLIGGSLFYWWHTTDWQWALIAVAAIGYVGIARRTGRSSWAVLGAAGLLAASTHFTFEWSHGVALPFSTQGGPPRAWVPPLVFAFTGFLLVALGLLAARRRSA